MPARKTTQEREIPITTNIFAKKTTTIIILLAAMLLFYLGGFFSRDIIVSAISPTRENSQIVTDFFMDVNGNGLTDYVIYAEIIPNRGTPDFQNGQ